MTANNKKIHQTKKLTKITKRNALYYGQKQNKNKTKNMYVLQYGIIIRKIKILKLN